MTSPLKTISLSTIPLFFRSAASRILRLVLFAVALITAAPHLYASILGVKDCDCTSVTIQVVSYPNNPADTLVVKLSKVTANGTKLAPVEVASTFSFDAQTLILVRTAAITGGAYWIEVFRNGVLFSNQNIVICDCPYDCGTPQILLTQDCPVNPVGPGGLLVYSGVVRNTGNITLSNIVVVNNRSQASTGTTASFVGFDTATRGDWKGGYGTEGYNIIGNYVHYPSYAEVTPSGKTDYLWSDSTNDVRALQKVGSLNGIAATWYAPFSFIVNVNLTDGLKHRLALYAVDWDTTARSEKIEILNTDNGQVLNSQTITSFNAGTYLVWDVSGNITVRFTRLAGNNAVLMGMFFDPTPVFTIASLAPGASASFTGSYVAPADCSSTSTSVASGRTVCGVNVTNASTQTCTISSTPALSIAEICPVGPLIAGSVVSFGGLISNTGDVALTNIRVGSSASGGQVFGPITLAPGASTQYTSSYVATTSNPKTNTTIVTNLSSVTITNIANLIVTNTTLVLTTNSASGSTSFGTINSLSSTAVDRLVVGQNFSGLTYAGEDHGYGATDFYSTRKSDVLTSFFDTITAGTATTTDRFQASNRNFDSLAYAAPDLGYGPLLFYYLSHDNAGVSTFGSITPGGTVGVVADHFVVGNNFDAITFAATDVGYGANLFYYVRHDANGVSTFGTINPALPGTITDRFTVGKNVDALVFTDLIAPGYGPNNFYYLRHDAQGVSTFGTIFVTGLASGTVTDRFQVGSNANELTFTATDVGFGANLFYFLRGTSASVTTNLVTTYTTNSTTSVTTNLVPVYVTNSIVSYSMTNIITVTGADVCQGRIVTAITTCTSAVILPPAAITQPPSMVSGTYKFAFASELGKSYTVQYKNTLSDLLWTDLQFVVGTGIPMNVVDPAAGGNAMRFYRVILTP